MFLIQNCSTSNMFVKLIFEEVHRPNMGLIEMLSLNTNISQVKSKHFNSSLFIIPISLEDLKEASLQAILDVYFCNSFFIVTMILAFFFVCSIPPKPIHQNTKIKETFI